MDEAPPVPPGSQLWAQLAPSLAVGDPLSGVLSKAMHLLQTLTKRKASAEELNAVLELSSAERKVAMKHDRFASAGLRGVIYRLTECVETTMKAMLASGRIKLKEEGKLWAVEKAPMREKAVETARASRADDSQENAVEAAKDKAVDVSTVDVSKDITDQEKNLLAMNSATVAVLMACNNTINAANRMKAGAPTSMLRPKRQGTLPVGFWSSGKIASTSPQHAESAALTATPTSTTTPSRGRKQAKPMRIEAPHEQREQLMEASQESAMAVLRQEKPLPVVQPDDEQFDEFSDIEADDDMPDHPFFATDGPTTLAAILSAPSIPPPFSLIDGIGHDDRCYRCDLCLKEFTLIANLKTHLKLHVAGPRKHKCEHCGMRFKRLEHVARHQKRSHCAYKPHLCDRCGKRFDSTEKLKDHKVLHEHQESKLRDENAESKIAKVGGLFACPHCSLHFKFKCHIERHLRIHTGERPFICDVCGKGFVQMTALYHHRRQHTGDRPFACTVCVSSFASSGALNIHLQREHGILSYECTLCGAKMSKLAAYREHKVACTAATRVLQKQQTLERKQEELEMMNEMRVPKNEDENKKNAEEKMDEQ